LEDQEILEKFKNVDTRNYGFNMLVHKYQQKVYWLIRRMVIDHDETDDLVQEVFIKVWGNLDKFRADAKLYTWLYRIATNEALTHLQKKKRRFFLPIHDVNAELENKISANLDVGMDGDQIEAKLQKALLKLPEKQRVVFQLRFYEEMPYEEMSEVTGTSVGALKASYHHAAKKVEEFLKHD
jgi:RNA polymerase sigma-70 factor (ECF subfamily)